jgi:hypothetical protein
MKLLTPKIMALALSLLTVTSTQAQSNIVPTHIKGTLDIRFDTRAQRDGSAPKVGVVDRYTLQINVCDTAILRGSVDARPHIAGKIYGVKQTGQLEYKIDLDACNPKNVSQCIPVGKMYGIVPVSDKNAYDFNNGMVKVVINGRGQALPFESKYTGVAFGKPPVVKDGVLTKLKKEAMSIGKTVNGKTVTIKVNDYDIMQFNDVVMPAGPAQSYPEVTVKGQFIYDYARSVWYMKDLTCAYTIGNIRYQDRLTGNIRWIETSSEYQFDVRVNEPLATEVAVFDNSQTDESAFFAEDTNLSGLVGTMKYNDAKNGSVVASSAITIDLKGNKLTKQQTMYLAKLFILTAIVPLNAE